MNIIHLIFSSLKYVIRADEEPVDPKKLLEDASKGKCARAWRAYEVTKYERPCSQES